MLEYLWHEMLMSLFHSEKARISEFLLLIGCIELVFVPAFSYQPVTLLFVLDGKALHSIS